MLRIMKRIIIFIAICLVFGAAMSIAVAWWATLRDWEFPDYFTFVQNGWKGGMEKTPARTLIGAIPFEQEEYALEGYEITVGLDYLPKTSPPAWFSLSTKPASETAIIRGIGAGWPYTCVYFIQEIESESFCPEWNLVRTGGLIGTNPFDRNSKYIWNNNHLPVRVIPLGLFLNVLIFG